MHDCLPTCLFLTYLLIYSLICLLTAIDFSFSGSRGNWHIVWKVRNFGKCIISYQEILRSVLKNISR